MKETYELNLNARFADRVLGAEHRLEDQSNPFSASSIRIKGEVGDELYLKARDVAASQPEAYANRIVLGCNITRSYTRREIEQGKLFLIQLRYQYGAAEEFGTWYTDPKPNPDCGIGRIRLKVVETNPFRSVLEETPNLTCALSSRQTGPLHFPFLKFVKRDIFSLWGGETILSERLAKLIEGGGFKGGKPLPIWNTRRGAQSLQDLSDCPTGMNLLSRAKQIGLVPGDRTFWSWLEADEQLPYLEKALWEQMEIWEARRSGPPPPRVYFQLRVDSSLLQVAEQTVLGDPFFGGLIDQCQCENGEIRGRLCSRLSIKASSWDGSDICQTDLFFGGKQGLFRPWRYLVISKRLFDAMRETKMKSFQFEIVEMV